jgi:hypothetical protein
MPHDIEDSSPQSLKEQPTWTEQSTLSRDSGHGDPGQGQGADADAEDG